MNRTLSVTLAGRRLSAVPRLLGLPLLVGLGALAALGQAPVSLPVATLLALVLAMGLFGRGGLGFGAGCALGLGYFGLALHWIVEPFLVEPERTGWMAPFGLAFTAAGFALFWGAAFGLARRLRLGLPGLVALWGGAEALRSLILTGFPWALVGHVWIDTPLVHLAAFVGPHGLTLLTLGAAALMAAPLHGAVRAGVPAALAAGAFLLGPGAGGEAAPDAPLIRIVQPNVPQHEKWNPALAPGHLRRLLDLSAEGAGRPDLLVWPETALSELLDRAGPILVAGARAAGGVPLATGVARMDAEGRYFNSLAVTDGEGAVLSVYDKVHLVPFGEYMPFRETLSAWGLRGIAEVQGSGFHPGSGAAPVDLPGIGPARALICYEGIFPEEFGAERPRLLLLVTNDAWFGNRAGPQQHLALARLRAVEFGLPVVRAANTGISAMIDGEGRVLASLPLNEAGVLEAPLPPALPPTLYARAGDAPALLALLLLLLLSFLRRNRVRGVDPGAPAP